MKDKQKRPLRHRVMLVITFILIMLAIIMCVVGSWYGQTFNISFSDLYFTMMSPLTGTGNSTISQVVMGCLPSILILIALEALIFFLLLQRKVTFRVFFSKKEKVHYSDHVHRPLKMLACSLVVLCFSVYYIGDQFRFWPYLQSLNDVTTIYEDYYVDPNDVSITQTGTKKNVICIYLESMETTYASYEDGGVQEVNYIPNLTAMANENTSFSNTNLLGGFHSVQGTGWTIASLFATTSGIPFAFPVGNEMDEHENFASGTTTMGDILEDFGYNQEFLCGSDAVFGGRDSYFIQHGNYSIYDYYTAIEQGEISSDYYVWWGFEDLKLYDIAKSEITRLAEEDEPFNFTFLTVDTHHVDGYVCDNCKNTYDNQLANVLVCSDEQIADFIDWCTQQDFYEDTVIVITGDHPRMDSSLVGGVDYDDRTVYNCIINSDTEIQGSTQYREFTAMDMFPTTLAAMGFEIEGDQLGLGVNLYSNKKTLSEQLGYEEFSSEFNKYSKYYIDRFS